jgi:anti-anti-sigma factor
MSDATYKHMQASTQGDFLILTLTDNEIREYEAAQDIRKELVDAAAQARPRGIVLDLGSVEFLASCGFLPILSLRRRATELGAPMVLCRLHNFVRQTLSATQLLISPNASKGVFEEYGDVNAAVAALQSSQ